MPDKIYIAYQRWHEVAPWFNWVKPRDDSTWWREHDRDEYCAVSSMKLTLGNDPILDYKPVTSISNEDHWLYEINWFYQDDLIPSSTILDSFISDPILMDGLVGGRGYLVLNLSLEAWCQPDLINHVQKFFLSKGIPLHRVIYMTGARNAKEIFQRNGYSIKPLSVMEFEMHASNKAREGLVWNGERRSVSKRFLCFNRMHRPHRIMLLSGLQERDLLRHFHFSFPRAIDGVDVIEYARSYMGHQTKDHMRLLNNLSNIRDLLPMVLDTDDWGPNLAHSHLPDDVLPFYQDSGISVITETTGYDEEIFFSEKTFHPIRYCQPFIMVSAPGTLSHLRDLGYRTFSDWWNEDYDSMGDHEDRMQAVLDQIEWISSWDEQKFNEFMSDSREICLHNLSVLISAADSRKYGDIWRDLFA